MKVRETLEAAGAGAAMALSFILPHSAGPVLDLMFALVALGGAAGFFAVVWGYAAVSHAIMHLRGRRARFSDSYWTHASLVSPIYLAFFGATILVSLPLKLAGLQQFAPLLVQFSLIMCPLLTCYLLPKVLREAYKAEPDEALWASLANGAVSYAFMYAIMTHIIEWYAIYSIAQGARI